MWLELDDKRVLSEHGKLVETEEFLTFVQDKLSPEEVGALIVDATMTLPSRAFYSKQFCEDKRFDRDRAINILRNNLEAFLEHQHGRNNQAVV